MVVGDVVNGIGAVGSAFTFQPAVGVSVSILCVGSHQTEHVSLTNAAGDDGIIGTTVYTNNEAWQANVKILINNTNFLALASSDVPYHACYTGIQIQ
jgi:hypothetical protein